MRRTDWYACAYSPVIVGADPTPAIAVGRDVFRPDASALCELLIRIQSKVSFL